MNISRGNQEHTLNKEFKIKLTYFQSNAASPPDKLTINGIEHIILPGSQFYIDKGHTYKIISKDPKSYRVYKKINIYGNIFKGLPRIDRKNFFNNVLIRKVLHQKHKENSVGEEPGINFSSNELNREDSSVNLSNSQIAGAAQSQIQFQSLPEFLFIIFLSFIQGISEVLPISSSLHLVLLPMFFGLNDQGLIIDIALHFGSLLAIIFFYKNKLVFFIDRSNIIKLILGTLPVFFIGFIGFIFSDFIIINLRNLKITSFSNLFASLFLFFVNHNSLAKKNISDLDYKNILIVGFFQSIALLPGISRLGIVITAFKILGFEGSDAYLISNLMIIPVLIIAIIYKLPELSVVFLGTQDLLKTVLSVIFSFIFTYISLIVGSKYINNNLFINLIIIYRLFLSVLSFLLIFIT
jgi:undecaprenyl-diphosphatase